MAHGNIALYNNLTNSISYRHFKTISFVISLITKKYISLVSWVKKISTYNNLGSNNCAVKNYYVMKILPSKVQQHMDRIVQKCWCSQ